jgi:hypothetical protein
MIRPRIALSALWLVWIAVLTTAPLKAGVPSLRAQTRLEDQLTDGEIDAEDFLAWQLAPGANVGPARGAVYLGVEAFTVQRAGGPSEWGALLVVELPLGRFARPRALAEPAVTAPIFGPPREDAGAAWLGGGESPRADDGTGDGALHVPAPRLEGASARAGLAETAAPKADRAAPAVAIAVTTEVARSCVRAALRTAGLTDDHRLDSVAARARSSAALPELRLRAMRTLGETGRVSLSEDDPSRYVASGAATSVLEARVTFRLDRLLFADEEIVVERARLDRSEQRLRITAKVIQVLFGWQKAYAELQDPVLSSEDRLSAAVREAESSAILDMMTGGWFGAYRAALATRGP